MEESGISSTVNALIPPSSFTSTTTSPNKYTFDMNANFFNFEDAISHLNKPSNLTDVPNILEKCIEKYKQVFFQHCENSGVHFIVEEDSTIVKIVLRQVCLDRALEDAASKSSTLLDAMVLGTQYQNKLAEIKVDFQSRLDIENAHRKQHHAKLYKQFQKATISRFWNEAVETLKTRYNHLINKESTIKPFYNQEKMHKCVDTLVRKTTVDCVERLSSLDETQRATRQVKINNPCLDLMVQSLKKCVIDLLERNRVSEQASRDHIMSLLDSKFSGEYKERLVNKIDNDLKAEICDEVAIRNMFVREKNRMMSEIVTFAEKVCVEGSQDFLQNCVSKLEEKMEGLVKHGVTLLEERSKKLDKLKDDVAQGLGKIVGMSGLPVGLATNLIRNMTEKIKVVIDDTKRNARTGLEFKRETIDNRCEIDSTLSSSETEICVVSSASEKSNNDLQTENEVPTTPTNVVRQSNDRTALKRPRKDTSSLSSSTVLSPASDENDSVRGTPDGRFILQIKRNKGLKPSPYK